jgi:hypothetical protein
MPRRREDREVPAEVTPRPTAAVGIDRIGMVLELVDETVDQEVDLDAMHEALAALLVRAYRSRATALTP